MKSTEFQNIVLSNLSKQNNVAHGQRREDEGQRINSQIERQKGEKIIKQPNKAKPLCLFVIAMVLIPVSIAWLEGSQEGK